MVRVTLTVTVQLVPIASEAPLSERLVPPEDAVATPPAQVVEALGVPALIMPVSAAPEVPSTV